MVKKLIAQIKGGLGNQMFAYATARRLTYINNAELVIDDISGFANDHLYQRKYSLDNFNIQMRKASDWERSEPFGKMRRSLNRRLSTLMPLDKRRYIMQSGVQFDARILSLSLQRGVTYFEGFGQSEDYFRDIEGIIRKDFQISEPLDNINQKLAESISTSNSIALHVRWFDMNGMGSQNNIALDYYIKAIGRIKKFIEQPDVYIFSDQIELTKKNLSPYLSGLNVRYVDHNQSSEMAYADLWLMSKCNHFIIANSTFSWWAAWLGEKKGVSQIYAPGAYIDPEKSVTAWGFEGLIPQRWKVL